MVEFPSITWHITCRVIAAAAASANATADDDDEDASSSSSCKHRRTLCVCYAVLPIGAVLHIIIFWPTNTKPVGTKTLRK